MPLPKGCKINVWDAQYQEYLCDVYAMKTAYVGVDCEGNPFDSDEAINRALGNPEKKFNFKTIS